MQLKATIVHLPLLFPSLIYDIQLCQSDKEGPRNSYEKLRGNPANFPQYHVFDVATTTRIKSTLM